MKIIIAGAGKIGGNLARILTSEGHNITVIDQKPDIIYQISNNLDVICVNGNATNSEILNEAGVENADLVIAATEKDEVNMICGISARKLGAKDVIARVRDTEYLDQQEFLKDALGLSLIINPEYECAKEISRIIRFPGADRVDTFSKSTAEIVEFKIHEGDKADGVQIKDFGNTFKSKVLVGTVERDGSAYIPKGDFSLKAGDRISIIGASKELKKLFASMGENKKAIKRVVIMGAGRTAVYLSQLLKDSGVDITIIEYNREHSEEVKDIVPEANVLCDDGTKGEVLSEVGLCAGDAFVALTGDDGDNIVTSMYAGSLGVTKVVTKVDREHMSDVFAAAHLDSIVSPKDVAAQQMARYVRASDASGGKIETLYHIADGNAEAVEFKVTEDSKLIGKALKDMNLKHDVLIAAVIRGKDTIIPDGTFSLQTGDHAVVVTTPGWIKNIDDISEED